MSGSGISWTICKLAPCARQITTPAPHHSVFYRLDALPASQPSALKHWRHSITHGVKSVLPHGESLLVTLVFRCRTCTWGAWTDWRRRRLAGRCRSMARTSSMWHLSFHVRRTARTSTHHSLGSPSQVIDNITIVWVRRSTQLCWHVEWTAVINNQNVT